MTDHRKQSLYFPEEMLKRILASAERLDRSYSWIVQQCVSAGIDQIEKMPTQKMGGK